MTFIFRVLLLKWQYMMSWTLDRFTIFWVRAASTLSEEVAKK
jgi:hypothetical protein